MRLTEIRMKPTPELIVVCVPYGYRSCERVEDLRADGVIPTLAELLDFLRSKYYPPKLAELPRGRTERN